MHKERQGIIFVNFLMLTAFSTATFAQGHSQETRPRDRSKKRSERKKTSPRKEAEKPRSGTEGKKLTRRRRVCFDKSG